MNLLKWFWLYPSMVVTTWTLLTFVAAWTFRRNRPFPRVFGLHLMMLQLNPKDEILYTRPSLKSALAYLVLSVTPLGGVLLVAAIVLAVVLVCARVQSYLQRRSKRQVST